MIAVRRLSRDEWKERLERYKFRPLDGKGLLNTAEWWQAPWGYPFTVPVEDDDTCDIWALEKLILDVLTTAPKGFSFDA
jgi:hypothetical protein